MIEFAPGCAEKLRELRGDDPSRAFLRLYVAGRSCSGYQYGLAFDSSADDSDQVIEAAGIPVAIDPQSQPYCDGATIEYVDETQYPGGGFRVTNAKLGGGEGCGGSCSCGH
ncbi:MAG TPA: iron-sulfur cluster assembly accessory protein [Candidatus Limnocylindria bacterium]|nr:iron-sulfur cluster assembly accessory protein [Candidatus Limnocylindria bacterium]